MKINKEIVDGVLVVTCSGSRLSAPLAQNFFYSLKGFFQKNRMGIVLDFSDVEFVDSASLGKIIRYSQQLNSHDRLVLCGVNEMVLSLLKMARMDQVFIHVANIKEAIATAIKGPSEAEGSTEPTPAVPVVKGLDDGLLSSLQLEDGATVQEVDSSESRKHQRLNNTQIVDKNIGVYCTSVSTGKRSSAVIKDISPGGFCLTSQATFPVGNEYIVEGRIGTIFRFKEHAIVRNDRNNIYGFEFLKPSEKTTSFLHQLMGSMGAGSAK